jgi:hypothetical protein
MTRQLILREAKKMEDSVWEAFKVWARKNKLNYLYNFATEDWPEDQAYKVFFAPDAKIKNAGFSKTDVKTVQKSFDWIKNSEFKEKPNAKISDICSHKMFKKLIEQLKDSYDKELATKHLDAFRSSPQYNAAVRNSFDVKKIAKAAGVKPEAEKVLIESVKAISVGKPKDAVKKLETAAKEPAKFGIEKGHLKKILGQLQQNKHWKKV